MLIFFCFFSLLESFYDKGKGERKWVLTGSSDGQMAATLDGEGGVVLDQGLDGLAHELGRGGLEYACRAESCCCGPVVGVDGVVHGRVGHGGDVGIVGAEVLAGLLGGGVGQGGTVHEGGGHREGEGLLRAKGRHLGDESGGCSEWKKEDNRKKKEGIESRRKRGGWREER